MEKQRVLLEGQLARLEEQRAHLERSERLLAQMGSELADVRRDALAQATETASRHARLTADVTHLQRELSKVYDSRTWRWTALLRAIASRIGLK
jgi:hypothetical protein